MIEDQVLRDAALGAAMTVALVHTPSLRRAERRAPCPRALGSGNGADLYPALVAVRTVAPDRASLAFPRRERPRLVDTATAQLFPLRHPSMPAARQAPPDS
jgi:hypothetical protein